MAGASNSKNGIQLYLHVMAEYKPCQEPHKTEEFDKELPLEEL